MGTFLENYEVGRVVDVDAIVHCGQKLEGSDRRAKTEMGRRALKIAECLSELGPL
jgi:hypothetical protein